MAISDIGTGTRITFGTSGFSAKLMSVEGPDMKRPSIQTTDMSTTNNHTFMPGDLVDRGEAQITVQFDPSLTPPIAGAAETVTITWPVPAGLTNAATWVFSGFMTDFKPSSHIEQLMEATATLKVSGGVTITAAS
jgi:hypothetical protein